MLEAVLLDKILAHLKLWNVKVNLAFADTVQFDGEDISGFFDQRSMTLGVAIKDENWFPVLIHEYCHFLQWKQGKWSSDKEIEEFTKRTEWVYKKTELSDEDVLRITRAIQACELDAEKNVVEMCIHHSVGIDIKDYIRESNAYVLTYEYERIFRKPCPPGTVDIVKHLMPDEFITDLATLPTGFIDLVNKVESTDESTTTV